MFVEDSGRLFVNLFDTSYDASLKDFLISCCDPVSRPQSVNEYALTATSLSAAAAEGTYTIDEIRRVLSKYTSDGEIPEAISELLENEQRSEKIQLVLQNNPLADQIPRIALSSSSAKSSSSTENTTQGLMYFLHCFNRSYLEGIVSEIKHFLIPFRVGGGDTFLISDVERVAAADLTNASSLRKRSRDDDPRSVKTMHHRVQAAHAIKTALVYKCMVKHGFQIQIREALYKRGIRVQCAYDYAGDRSTTPVENFALKPGVRLRPYQDESLERFRRGGKAHNGIVVLPCGAGKTLTGIAAASIVGKRVIVMCCNVMSVMQWQREFLRWTTLTEEQVTVCVRGLKQKPGDVFITTYSMLTAKRADRGNLIETEDARATRQILEEISNATWGTLLLDEVHIAPAERFQEVINRVRHHCVIGLSATLLREDRLIENLRFLVGPKLYEANWLELTKKGYLAEVVCMDVRCPMPPSYLRLYLDPQKTVGDDALGDVVSMNPYKLWVTQALLHFHSNRVPSDKVIIFCDSIPCLYFFATTLGIPFMDGKTPEAERETLLAYFKNSTTVNTIILSRVGDIALDIPEASVIIQISGLGASRRQEAQRLGRILRPKPASMDGTTAYFYTLVSEDTDEARDAFGRQEWLRDQGFSYRMLPAVDILNIYKQQHQQRAVKSTRSPSSLLCVGAPKWYWLSDPEDSDALIAEFVKVPSDSSLGMKRGWVPFSSKASQAIDYLFRRGQASGRISRKTSDLVTFNPKKDVTHSTSASSSCYVVTFSAADAPDSFGTVTFYVEGDHHHESTGSLAVQRRISKYAAESTIIGYDPTCHVPHDCMMSDDCLNDLLCQMNESRRRKDDDVKDD